MGDTVSAEEQGCEIKVNMHSEEGEKSEAQTNVHELAPATKSAGWAGIPRDPPNSSAP